MICASVVFPVPGGPEKMTEGSRSASIARRRSLPGARICSCPTNSSSERGLHAAGERCGGDGGLGFHLRVGEEVLHREE